MCFDTAKSKISQNAAIPANNYGFTKQKHIRGDKTLKIYNFGPNVVYAARSTPGRARAPCESGARGQLSEILGTRLMHQNPIVQALFGEQRFIMIKNIASVT